MLENSNWSQNVQVVIFHLTRTFCSISCRVGIVCKKNYFMENYHTNRKTSAFTWLINVVLMASGVAIVLLLLYFL